MNESSTPWVDKSVNWLVTEASTLLSVDDGNSTWIAEHQSVSQNFHVSVPTLCWITIHSVLDWQKKKRKCLPQNLWHKTASARHIMLGQKFWIGKKPEMALTLKTQMILQPLSRSVIQQWVSRLLTPTRHNIGHFRHRHTMEVSPMQ